MRVFFGIELPEDVKAAAGEVAVRAQARVKKSAARASVRWVDAANLHITLWFIGEIDDARLAQLTAATSQPFPLSPFRLKFSGLGAFPPSGSPRVFWIGLESGTEQLQTLYAELARRLMPLGLEPERRPYSPHLTLARIKDVRRSDVPSLRAGLDVPFEAFECHVSAVTLFRSRLSPKGAQYEALLRVPLA